MQTCSTIRKITVHSIVSVAPASPVKVIQFIHLYGLGTRVFGFFTFSFNHFLYTILRVQINMKKNRGSFFEKFFYLYTLGGYERFLGGRVGLISHNSKTTAPRKTIFISIDSETQVFYLCSIHYVALTALFYELFSKNCFYPFLLAISL